MAYVLTFPCSSITIVPPEVGKLIHLTLLRLDRNQIVTLPPEVGQMAALRTLDLLNNDIRKVPIELGLLLELQVRSWTLGHRITVGLELSRAVTDSKIVWSNGFAACSLGQA